jgi:plasmid maintenance system antidote protein VapI
MYLSNALFSITEVLQMGELTSRLIRRLREWCDKERGRKAKVGRLLGVSAQAVSNLLAGRQQLTGEQALAIQAFLKKHRRNKPE